MQESYDELKRLYPQGTRVFIRMSDAPGHFRIGIVEDIALIQHRYRDSEWGLKYGGKMRQMKNPK